MTIYLDFDGTVVEHKFPKIGRCNFGCIEIIKKLQDAGHEIILNTYRADIDSENPDLKSLDKALELLNKRAYMLLRDKTIDIGHFRLKPIVATKAKIHPSPWNLHEAIKIGVMYIDDIASDIPLKPAVMISGNMVDWDVLDAQFKAFNIY